MKNKGRLGTILKLLKLLKLTKLTKLTKLLKLLKLTKLLKLLKLTNAEKSLWLRKFWASRRKASRSLLSVNEASQTLFYFTPRH